MTYWEQIFPSVGQKELHYFIFSTYITFSEVNPDDCIGRKGGRKGTGKKLMDEKEQALADLGILKWETTDNGNERNKV